MPARRRWQGVLVAWWRKLWQLHTGAGRFYHTLHHLRDMFHALHAFGDGPPRDPPARARARARAPAAAVLKVDTTCLVSTGVGTRRVRLVRGGSEMQRRSEIHA